MSLLPGDPAPYFTARTHANPEFKFDTAAGRYVVLLFVQSSRGVLEQNLIATLAAQPFFDDVNALFFIVSGDPADEHNNNLPLRVPGVRIFYDQDHRIANLYQIPVQSNHPVTLVFNPRLQLIGSFRSTEMGEQAAQTLRLFQHVRPLANLPSFDSHPPILMLAGVFEPALCRSLIEGYEAHGGEASGFMRDVSGQTVGMLDPNYKVRRDWWIDKENLVNAACERITRRIVPEVAKSFQFHATRIERCLVGCYSADDGGHFHAHRDNTSKDTIHRRFAITINLNAEDYEGGDLCFPEFGQKTYRAPTGGCVVFSCSLLHEVKRVVRGMRYAFLPFIHDEEAQDVFEKICIEHRKLHPAEQPPSMEIFSKLGE